MSPYSSEMRSREEITADTNRKIKYTLELAYNHSPIYRSKFDALGIKPDAITDSESLAFYIRKGLRLTKEELIKDFRKVVMDYSNTIPITELWSAGSTGAPKRVWYGPDDLKRSYEQVMLSYNAMGLSRGDYVVNIFSPPPNSSGPLAQQAGIDMGLHMLQMGVQMPTDRLLQIIKMCNPKSIFAISTRMNQLPEEIEKTGENVRDLGIESLLTGGESYSKEKKQSIKSRWGNICVSDVWASTEASVMGYMDNNCNSSGMHIVENRLLIDAVDSETLESVGVGKVGIDLITTLYDEDERPATVLIGYSHNDLIKILDLDKCSCGRTYKMIEWPITRKDDIIHLAGQNINFRLGTEASISEHSFLTGEYMAIYMPINLTRTKPYLEIRIESRIPVSDISRNEKVELENDIWSNVISNPAAEGIIFSQSDAKIQIVERGELFKGYEKHNKPGKPVRLIKL